MGSAPGSCRAESFGETTVDVGPDDWLEVLTFCRDQGLDFFDWLTGVDDPPEGFAVVAHLADQEKHERLLVRTRVPLADPVLPSAVGVFRGADWHERETFEMFGVVFEGHPDLKPCCCPTGSRAIRCARASSWPPGWPRPGPAPRSPASRAPARRPGARCCRPECRPTGGAMPELLEVAIRLVVIVGAFLVLPLIVGQMEHKAMAHMQSRLGPMYAGGFHGWAQLIADGVKFMQKEDVIPAAADRTIFKLAPAVALVPYLVVLVVIPIGPGLLGVDLDAGIFFVLAVMGVGVLGSIMAGWSSGNKYSVLGGCGRRRSSCRTSCPWSWPPPAWPWRPGRCRSRGSSRRGSPGGWPGRRSARWCSSSRAWPSCARPPFDMPIAESEIIMGPMTEYTGMRFALFMLTEYAGIVVLSALTTVLFLGGWQGPLLPGPVWTLLKIFALAFVVIWVRVSFPRMREDQLQRLAWVGLVPLALVQPRADRGRESPLTSSSGRCAA